MFIGILIGILLTLAYACLYLVGVWLGIMGTDSCHEVDSGPAIYLFIGWPLLLLIAAWIPSVLHWIKIRWAWVWVTAILLGLGSIAAYLIYPIWLGYSCR